MEHHSAYADNQPLMLTLWIWIYNKLKLCLYPKGHRNQTICILKEYIPLVWVHCMHLYGNASVRNKQWLCPGLLLQITVGWLSHLSFPTVIMTQFSDWILAGICMWGWTMLLLGLVWEGLLGILHHEGWSPRCLNKQYYM